MVMYFIFCDACQCFEYDCHGLEGCITLEDNYLKPHRRYDIRKRAADKAAIIRMRRRSQQ